MNSARFTSLPFLGALLLCGACSSSSTAGGPTAAPPENPSGSDAGAQTLPAEREVLESVVISKRDESVAEAEPSLVVSSDKRIVSVWYSIVGSSMRIAYRMSADDGATFGEIKEMPIPKDNNVCANAALAAGEDGTVYVTYACQKRTAQGRQNARVWAARSSAGSDGFEEPVEVSPANEGGSYDQPRIAVVHGGSVIVTFMQAVEPTWSLIAASTTDFVTFHPTTVATGGSESFSNFARPCASKTTERVGLMMWEWTHGVTLFTSDDGGATWPAERRIVVSPADEANQTTPFQECVAGEGNELFIMYGLSKDPWKNASSPTTIPMLRKIRVAHTDGIAVESITDIEEPGAKLIQPSIALDDAGGVDVAYYAGAKAGDAKGSYRFRRSTDKAKTFADSIVVREPLPFETDRASRRTPGDYMGLWGTAGKLYVAYTDTTEDFGHIAFYRTTLP